MLLGYPGCAASAMPSHEADRSFPTRCSDSRVSWRIRRRDFLRGARTRSTGLKSRGLLVPRRVNISGLSLGHASLVMVEAAKKRSSPWIESRGARRLIQRRSVPIPEKLPSGSIPRYSRSASVCFDARARGRGRVVLMRALRHLDPPCAETHRMGLVLRSRAPDGFLPRIGCTLLARSQG